MGTVGIRLARPGDLDVLPAIEVAAGQAFRSLGMAQIADDPPLAPVELAAFEQDGRAWVATDADGAPVAYLLLEMVDAYAHVEQVSVHPEVARRGIGRLLIGAAEEWARQHGRPGLTLTTFTDVRWNAPYYRRLGFVRLRPSEIGPDLARIRGAETARGLDSWPREAMVKKFVGVTVGSAAAAQQGGEGRCPSVDATYPAVGAAAYREGRR